MVKRETALLLDFGFWILRYFISAPIEETDREEMARNGQSHIFEFCLRSDLQIQIGFTSVVGLVDLLRARACWSLEVRNATCISAADFTLSLCTSKGTWSSFRRKILGLLAIP
jgi:hypothetical protein